MDLQTAAAPLEGPLVDTFGRVADDLRISVTDRCNFRCTYCMPAEGLAWLPKSELLTFEELTRLLGIFVELGVRSLKVTGGEPTVRADLPNLVRMFRGVGPDLDISITTNGVLLDRLAAPLAEAGIDRATVSCDSLLRHRFAEMTRRDALEKVLAGLRAAEAAGLTPIKINCVVIGGTNDDEVVEFARWARETGTRSGSSSTCRSTPTTRGSGRRSCPRRGSSPRSTRSIRCSGGPRARARDQLPVRRRRPRPHRRDPERHRTVLRHLQPAPSDRGGPVPQLPVRP